MAKFHLKAKCSKMTKYQLKAKSYKNLKFDVAKLQLETIINKTLANAKSSKTVAWS